jgi:hypothetical protein
MSFVVSLAMVDTTMPRNPKALNIDTVQVGEAVQSTYLRIQEFQRTRAMRDLHKSNLAYASGLESASMHNTVSNSLTLFDRTYVRIKLKFFRIRTPETDRTKTILLPKTLRNYIQSNCDPVSPHRMINRPPLINY